ncbi:MAG TPA: response regulator transcription factor [Candidatus Polarisedimenticolaceae bacterium]|nr:response regulator transcription factor [Candidatus Polarisedimenticolaceae bacterium]
MTRRVLLNLALYAACGGLVAAALRVAEYHYALVSHSMQIYVGVVAVIFAGVGIWLGGTLTKKKPEVIVREVPVEVRVPGPFVLDEARLGQLQITPRELEILRLVSDGLSNKEIAERVFVSENTVKTHVSRVFDKLGARRRTEAVQLAKAQHLIP